MALALASGTRIGGFELGDVIGRGGFGITYRAIHAESGQTYAIKEYLPEDFARRTRSGMVSALQGHGEVYARGLDAFLTEANILKELPRRDGLVRVRGAFEKFDTAYCVMEFIEGGSLERMARRMQARAGHIPAELLTDLALAVLRALDALHAHGVIHRDVKPANIMIRRDGTPVLIDFGAARRLTRQGTSEAIFTRRYAALEQFPPDQTAFGRSFDEGPWSDLYSLCVVLYELVAQERPPDAQSRAEAVLSGRPDPYVPLSRKLAETGRRTDLGEAALAAIDAGLGLLPAARPATARALADLLAPGAWDAARTEAIPAPAGPPAPRRPRRALLPLVVAALALLGAALIWSERLSIERF